MDLTGPRGSVTVFFSELSTRRRPCFLFLSTSTECHESSLSRLLTSTVALSGTEPARYSSWMALPPVGGGGGENEGRFLETIAVG